MTLPQETQQAIASKAAAYADQQHAHEGDDIHVGYLAGATEWAGKAQQFADVIQRSLDQHEADKESLLKEWPQLKNKIDDSMMPWINEARQLLAKYKEVTNG